MFKAYFKYRKLLNQIYKCKTVKEFNKAFDAVKEFHSEFEKSTVLQYNLANRWALQADLLHPVLLDAKIRKM